MKFFVCLIDAESGGILEAARRRYERLAQVHGVGFHWQRVGQVSVLCAGDNTTDDPVIAVDGESVAVGSVRLDDRAALERGLGRDAGTLTDLALALRAIGHHGAGYIPRLLGDFGFVVWNARTRCGVAAVDAFALKKLYWMTTKGLLAFSSRAEALALDGRYEAQYLAELIALCSPSPTLTPYAGIQPVAAATMAVLDRGRVSVHRYWSPDEFEPQPVRAMPELEATRTCRELLARAVRSHLGRNGDAWAQLSGGTDSSSVVSMAQWLAERGEVTHGLAGTVTYADRSGSAADEREYSGAVVDRWGVPNETIVDPPFWLDERWPPPRTDFPCFTLPFYPRERLLCSVVCGAGGRVLLTGTGGDELFTGTMLFFADWVARGRVWPAVCDMVQRAVIGRVSFWQLAYLNAVFPLLPRALRHRFMESQAGMPPWVPQAMVRRYGLRDRTFPALSYGGRVGHKYHDAIAVHVIGLGTVLDTGTVIPDALDLRHPFLYRPLVEFALRLPPEFLVRPNARKWILREAMRGILPDSVRNRIGKGSPAELYASALAARRRLLEPLVEEPILADLGVVDARVLRAAFNDAPPQPHSKEHWHAVLQFTLAVEAWLQMRSGRWPCEDSRRVGSTPKLVHSPSI